MNYKKQNLDTKMRQRIPRKEKHPAGFTLIEVLVALVIISIGLLGLAALQSQGLQDNKSAILRSVAVQSAADILDRMRANRTAALNGSYNIDLNTAPPTVTTTLDKIDLSQWKKGLALSLPSGNGSVNVNGNIVTVEVRWRESGWTKDDDDQIVKVVTRL
jgi:type IV pilus assembly protein PilV